MYRHPGNHEDTELYFMHCPEAAQPNVTFLGVVHERDGQLNHGFTLLHYRLQVTVYNSSTRTPHTFPITIYFKNGNRWTNFPPLTPQTQIFVTGRIFGVTKENQQLAVITEDIHFIPTLTQSIPPSPVSTGKRKRPDRWGQRVFPSTPSQSASFADNDHTAVYQSTPYTTIKDPPTTSDNTAPTTTDEDKEAFVTWPATPTEPRPSPEIESPSERRSTRRKTNHTIISS